LTTIIAAGNAIYADSRCTSGNLIISNNVNKLLKVIPKGMNYPVLFGGAGSYEELELVKDWIAKGMLSDQKPELENFEGLMVVRASKTKCNIYYLEDSLLPILVEDKCTAIGSGSVFAFTALDCGCTPEQAIQAAIKRDNNSGGRVRRLEI
jgi:ATP-dependent protease HslVU (ClpYQ) peptidase subunit